MTKPLAACSKCKGEMSPKVHGPFHGEEGGLRLTLTDMPYAACLQGHKRFLSASFSANLMDLMASPDTYRDLPAAVKKGLLTKHYHCAGCGQELPASPTARRAVEVAAEIGKARPFQVTVEVPVFKCGGCGKESVRSAVETGNLALKATGHAFRAADIHPT
jgi:DNA-directed RNA polymerase subunit RPC12/RpoP